MSILVRGLDGDCRERRTGPGPGPMPPSKGPIAITASVGLGGQNRKPDVLTIQSALNDIEPSDGGPSPKLSVDGIVGPLTNKAIAGFQRRAISFVDSRVDPNGPTIKAINQRRTPILSFGLAVGETPFFQDQTVVEEVLASVPMVRGALFLARNRVESIAPFVGAGGLSTPSGPGSERDAFNVGLVDEVFRLSEFFDPRGSYNRIRFQFENMLQTIRACQPALGPVNNGLFLRNKVADEEANPAYVVPFGKFSPDATTTADDGTVISTKHVHICDAFKTTLGIRRRIIALVAHELSHFVSPPGFHVGDLRRGHSDVDQESFRTGSYDRISNAENYAWFAWRSFEGPFAF